MRKYEKGKSMKLKHFGFDRTSDWDRMLGALDAIYGLVVSDMIGVRAERFA